jgi:hypothetical protein
MRQKFGYWNSRRRSLGCNSRTTMGILPKLKSHIVQLLRSPQYLAAIAAGSDNEQRLLNDKLMQAIAILTDMSNVLRSKLDALVAGSKHEQRLLNERLGATIAQLNDMTNVLRSKLDGVVKGLDDHAKLSNGKFDALITGLNNQTRLLNEKLDILIANSAEHLQSGAGKRNAQNLPDNSSHGERRSPPS